MTTISASMVSLDYQVELERHLFESLTMLERMLKALTVYSAERMTGTGKYARVAKEAEVLVKKIRENIQ